MYASNRLLISPLFSQIFFLFLCKIHNLGYNKAKSADKAYFFLEKRKLLKSTCMYCHTYCFVYFLLLLLSLLLVLLLLLLL